MAASGGAATSSLQIRHIFGVNTNVVDNLSYTDDDTLVYVAGHSLVLYSVPDKRQRFIQSSEITESISTFTSGSGKRLCAIAEKCENPSFHIFDLRTFRRKKSLTTSDFLSKELVSMQFSEDNQLILVLTGAPDFTLMCWNWAKAKLIASAVVSVATSPVHRCMFSPLDASIAVVLGQNVVKFFRIGEREIRPMHENSLPGNNFISSCWMRTPDDHLLAGTEDGKIMLFRSGEFLLDVPESPGDQFPITCLNSTSTGFVAGSGPGRLFFYHYDESKDQALFDTQFTLVNTVDFSDMCPGFVTTLEIDPRDETISMLTSCGQIVSCPATTVTALEAKQVTHTVSAFHNPKPISGLDVALRKPLILTCSKDNSLRLWNYRTHTLEQMKVFPEEMHSVALHPTGLHCAIGFTDKLRIYHVLVDDLRICLEVSIKACRICRFSNGGQMLAAASGNSIVIYDFYTGEKICDLRGHNSKVRSIHWLPSGFQLLSCGQDGAVYVWSIDGAKRIGEFVQKGTMYTSAVNTNSSVVVVGNDRSLRELALPDLAPTKLSDAGLVLTNVQIALNKAVLFASTYEFSRPGCIRAYPYPTTGEFDEYPCTNAQILRLCMTYDENFMVVADEQGCLVVFELKNRQDRFQRNNPAAYPELYVSPEWSDEVLVTRAELEDCNTTVAELQTKVEELKLNNEYQLKLKDMNYSEKIKETTDKFVQELELAKSKFEMLQDVRVDYEIESIEKIKYIEELHQNNVQNMETGFQAQIMEMVENYQKLVHDRDGQIERLDEQRRQLVHAHERYVEELTQDFERKLDEERQTRLQLEDERGDLGKELNEMQDQLDDDIDTEIENMKRVNEEKLSISRETTLKYKGENGIMKKKSVLMTRDIEDQKEEMKQLLVKEKELHDKIKILEKEVSAHKKEIKTRDVSIGEKEKRIYELKKKNQELDKFKFVLDFKIRELKQQIEPRQMEIMAMREKIKDMDDELERYHKSNAALDGLIGELREKIDAEQKDAKAKRMQAKTLENTIETCRSDVQSAIVHIQTPNLLIQAVKQIVELYGSMENVRPRIDPEVEDEYARHKEYLQKSIQDLKKALEEGSVHHMNVNNQIREANMNLINEINTQRESNRQLKNHVAAEIGRIRHFAQSLNMKKKGIKPPQTGGHKTVTPVASSVGRGIFSQDSSIAAGNDAVEPSDLLEKNRRRILALRAALAELEARAQGMMQKAVSREVLPPMDGASTGDMPMMGLISSGGEGSLPAVGNNNSNNNVAKSAGGAGGQPQSVGIALPPVNKAPAGGLQQGTGILDMGDSLESPGAPLGPGGPAGEESAPILA